MVITMSVMPLFTYPNLSLYSHRVITVLYNLQIFLCPMNENVTRVHCATLPDIRTSDVLVTFVATLPCLGAASAGVAFGTISPCAGCPPPYPV
jgi:hypothetical protein